MQQIQVVDDKGDSGGFHVSRGSGFPFKRNPPHPETQREHRDNDNDRRTDRKNRFPWKSRSPHIFRGGGGFFSSFFFKGKSLLYSILIAAVVVSLLTMILQSLMAANIKPSVTSDRLGDKRPFGAGISNGPPLLRFVPFKLHQRFSKNQAYLHHLRTQTRYALRSPRLAIVLGSMEKDASSLMLLTLGRSLQLLGYKLTIYAVKDGYCRSLWAEVCCKVSLLDPESSTHVDWSIFEGILLSSLEAKFAILSLMQEPFCSVPLIWIVYEDTLGKRLSMYAEMGWEQLIIKWRSAFSRADVVVFPDFSLPMLYSELDTGNFFVISGSPADVWAVESYKSQSKYQLRKDNGFHEDDLVVLVIGNSYDLPWKQSGCPVDYLMLHAIRPLLLRPTTRKDPRGSFKFVFLCINSTKGNEDALQELASRMGFPAGSVMWYSMVRDINDALLMTDIVLYASFQDSQDFPPLLIRAMSLEIPIIAPNLTIIRKYVQNRVHGLIFQSSNVDTLTGSLKLLVSNMRLSKLAHSVASSGRLLANNMMALDCIAGYADLLEKVLQFPSDTMLPDPVSELKEHSSIWEWGLMGMAGEETVGQNLGVRFEQNISSLIKTSIVNTLEAEWRGSIHGLNSSEDDLDGLTKDNPTQLDWDDLREMEALEDYERHEIEELEGRMEKTTGSWEDVYRNARKIEKLKFEANERDEGELERTGQPLCIYEIYPGEGAWPFLHHGSLYRGLSLSAKARRPRSDDVDAVERLSFLNDTYYRDILCETGGMFSIANRIDNVHKIPWIGFQSWRATGKKVALSIEAENVLEETINAETKGDVIYYWARLDMQDKATGDDLDFWSMCDILNGEHCIDVFEQTFRHMYGLPSNVTALPPMPHDGYYWSSHHSWAMSTSSFLEFVMFSRMFASSLDSLNRDSSRNAGTCLLGSLKLEEKHCYCRILELLVNVWAYHSGRKMVYMDPESGFHDEQHPLEERYMWVKYFNFTLLKSMDEDLAEEADDSDNPDEGWLWPLTGEVHWQGIYEREREERYRQKMEKKRKTKEKLLERQKYGYKQKSLGG